MIYEIFDNLIKVYDKNQFNPKHILECGQLFRYGKNTQDNYFVISKNKKATIIEKKQYYEIKCDDPKYFVSYFDLDNDYSLIKKQLKQNEILSPMVDFGYGIRIVKGDPFEMIVSYIISQNNNISRIQKIIEKLCKIGTFNGDFYEFPTIEQFKNLDENFFKNLGAGYRDKFLFNLAQEISEEKINNLKNLSTDNLKKELLKIFGIGPKVASCISLFGFGRMEKFPVDTWIEQVYYNHFSSKKRNRVQIENYFENIFKDYSGIAQQYLFYFERNKKEN